MHGSTVGKGRARGSQQEYGNTADNEPDANDANDASDEKDENGSNSKGKKPYELCSYFTSTCYSTNQVKPNHESNSPDRIVIVMVMVIVVLVLAVLIGAYMTLLLIRSLLLVTIIASCITSSLLPPRI